jgi:hypothetical protein
MAAQEHGATAARHRAEGEEHAAEYDPAASKTRERCIHSRRGVTDDPCWVSIVNPTREHLAQEKEHRRAAEEHRSASAALREAEERACTKLSPADRDMSPFEHTEDISSVMPLGDSAEPLGVRVGFKSVPGLTAGRLQRLVDCHMARAAALGHSVPEMPDCPLVPKGVRANVATTTAGLVVEIRSDDPRAARESVARAMRLAAKENQR